jgi:signal transduction histidine kinase
VEISALPDINLDGLHPRKAGTAEVFLQAGRTPVCLEWFNYWQGWSLDVMCSLTNESPRPIAATNLWHAVTDGAGRTNFQPGLAAECFEGSWDLMPDFNLLRAVTNGITGNFDVRFRSRNDRVGIRYTGFLEVAQDGVYRFNVWSDDGALLYVGDRHVAVTPDGRSVVPAASRGNRLGTEALQPEGRCWVEVEGRVTFVTQTGEGVKFELRADQQVISVGIADASGLDLTDLLNARVRVKGVGRGLITASESMELGKLFAASARDLAFIEHGLAKGTSELPLTSVAKVQGLSPEEARKALPVRIRGTVTGTLKTSTAHWMSIQDDTRGIFVPLGGVTNVTPAVGELWEVEGHSEAGNFSAVLVAKRLRFLGEGFLPPPVRPTWTELLNGSRDVQWVELVGLATEVHSNTICLQLPEGRVDVELEGRFASELRPFARAVVRIRGVLYAIWDEATHEVRVGKVMVRNPVISVDMPAPTDPFDAVLRTPRELRLFDAQATAFRPVKVQGQVAYADANQLFLAAADDAGLRVLPMDRADARPGDLVEVVGYPEIGQGELLLREALLRRTGDAPLPPPVKVGESDLQWRLNGKRVRTEGKLLGWHTAEGSPVLEMQSGNRLYFARIAAPSKDSVPFPAGSRLAMDGVYVGRGHGQNPVVDHESFELLLNSLADVTVLSRPAWWTLPRVMILLGVVMVILAFTVLWNTQLRRLVEQRTGQLQRVIRERERLERQHAIESERSRIARDLHDDLGSSLTEISVLASTGQLATSQPQGQAGLFQSISTRARSMIAALDVIVWAVDPEDNSLQSLADYLTGYTAEFFSHTQIACRFKVPVSFPSITVEGSVRHDLLLAVKEALNNVVRHADATELDFRLAIVGQVLEIYIGDNGRGIEDGANGSGHGLRNLSTRLDKLGGHCRVTPRSAGGTTVMIRFPLTSAREAVTTPHPHR